MVGNLLAALWQGGLILLGLIIQFAGGYIIIYLSTWGKAPHWIEGFRDRFSRQSFQHPGVWKTSYRSDNLPSILACG